MLEHPLTYWLLFSHSKLIYQHSITEIVQHYQDPEYFIRDNIKTFDRFKKTDWSLIEQACRWADMPNQQILTFNDPAYPHLLKEIAYPPPILYVQGLLETLRLPQIAVVGSRYPSHSGLSITEFFTKDLVQAGLCITSGLATGIDGISHKAALKYGGRSIAVLGSGLYNIYPKCHADLSQRIIKQGCLLSEFPLNAKPYKKNFPQRNRIISGLSLGTLVVEAKQRSGSLITAHYAAEQGRDVFAVPGSIRHALSQGCHQLLREGALLVESAQDIINSLSIVLTKSASKAAIVKENSSGIKKLNKQQQQLLACVDYEGCSIDKIIERSGVSTDKTARLLLNLELHGYISSTYRGYVRVK